MYIGKVTIHGDTLSAYDKDTWELDIWWDTLNNEIYTEDQFGDFDTIGEAKNFKEAIQFTKKYFSKDNNLTIGG